MFIPATHGILPRVTRRGYGRTMDTAYALRDCPDCRGVRTVILDVCYVCFAEFGEERRSEGWWSVPTEATR